MDHISLETGEATPTEYTWEDMFSIAEVENCLITGKRFGVGFEVVNFEDTAVLEEEDEPATIQISRITEGQLDNRIVIGAITGIPTNPIITNPVAFTPNLHNYSNLSEPCNYRFMQLTPDNIDSLEANFAQLWQLHEEDYPEEIQLNQTTWDLGAYNITINDNKLLFLVEELEILRKQNSNRSETVKLRSTSKPGFYLYFDIRSGYKITRERVRQPDGGAKNLYTALEVKKVSSPRIHPAS